MCGRFLLDCDPDDVAKLAHSLDQDAPPPPKLTKRYNIAPTQQHLILVATKQCDHTLSVSWQQRTFGHLRPERPLLLNARAETAHRLPTFRRAWLLHRCIVPATGFYEWQPHANTKSKKTPYLIRQRNGGPFGFAALALGEGAFVIVTTEASEAMMPIHARMPVMLTGARLLAWLDPKIETSALSELCNPLTQPALQALEISRRVNNPRNDDKECIAPAAQRSLNF